MGILPINPVCVYVLFTRKPSVLVFHFLRAVHANRFESTCVLQSRMHAKGMHRFIISLSRCWEIQKRKPDLLFSSGIVDGCMFVSVFPSSLASFLLWSVNSLSLSLAFLRDLLLFCLLSFFFFFFSSFLFLHSRR